MAAREDWHMHGRLEGKVAVITGAGSGIGQATAKLFAQEGAYVFVTDFSKERAERTAAEIGSRAIGVRVDVTCMADIDALYKEVAQSKGQFDVLFANAG